MSPEQARGEPVDTRTDIWAYGCVLFEMCAQRPPFAGATISDALTAVVESEPAWGLLRTETPANVVRLLRRCLTKNPELRLPDIGEARVALETAEPAARLAGLAYSGLFYVVLMLLPLAVVFIAMFAIGGAPRSLSPDDTRPAQSARGVESPTSSSLQTRPAAQTPVVTKRGAGARRSTVKPAPKFDRPSAGDGGEIVFLTSGKTLSVKAHRTYGDLIVFTLNGGGEVVCDKSLVRKIIPTEAR
jgi:hypothetical protein